MTMHYLYTILAAEHAAETLTWWQEALTMVKSPAHWASEGMIEVGLGILGWHTVGKLAHRGKHLIVKGVKHAIKLLTGRVKRGTLSS